jgi:hypothetical protein
LFFASQLFVSQLFFAGCPSFFARGELFDSTFSGCRGRRKQLATDN